MGGPLVIEELPVHEPGRAEVRVAVQACNVVPNLANVLRSWSEWFPYRPLPTLPAIFGLDPAGIVDAVGADAEGIEVGQRVYVNPGRVGVTQQVRADGVLVEHRGATSRSRKRLSTTYWTKSQTMCRNLGQSMVVNDRYAVAAFECGPHFEAGSRCTADGESHR
ncbi:NADPH:quinone reductase-like Zn-dependent oxidoreductase [Nocardia sp. GAS34]|uniref:alcohol dehydrogenase catalytic domain-containing protein n=1 Tax=Nocardia sp. GP40 TaxID=3156268 RepID=UPI003D1BE3D4